MRPSSRYTIAVLGLLAVDYVAAQFVAIPRAKIIADAVLRGDDLSLTAAARAALPTLAPFVLVAILAVTGLIVLELRTRCLRAFLHRTIESPRAAWRVTFVICAVFATAILGPGSMVRSDSLTHVLRAQYFLDVLRQGQLPLWATQWYGGYPFGQFYSQLTNLLVAPPALVFGVNFGAKLVMFAAHLVGCWGMFRLVLASTKRPWVAAWSALAFGVIRSHLSVVFFHGSFPGGIVLAMLPLVFLAGRSVSREPGLRRILGLSLVFAVLTWAHLGFLRPMALPWFVWLIHSVLTGQTTTAGRTRAVGRLVAAHVIALVLCLPAWIPPVMERSLVYFPSAFVSLPLPRSGHLAEVFLWSPWHPAFQGLVVTAIATLSLVPFPGRRTAGGWLLLAAGVVYVLWYPEERCHHLLGFLLVLVAGLGLQAASVDRKPGLLLLLISALLLEQGPFWLMNTYETRRHWAGATDAQVVAALAEEGDPTRRVLVFTSQAGRLHWNVWHLFRDLSIPTLSGPFKQGTPQAYRPTGQMISYVTQVLSERGTLDDTARAGLALANVGLLSFEKGSESHVATLPAGARFDEDAPLVHLAQASPLWFFDEVRSPDHPPDPPGPPPAWDHWDPQVRYESTRTVRILQDMQLVPAESRGRTLFAEASAPVAPNPTADGAPLRVIHSEFVGQGARHVFETSRTGYVRLSQNDYRYRTIRLDGALMPVMTDALGAPFVPVAPGRHEIVWQPTLSPLRRGCAIVSAMAGLAVLLAWVGDGRRRHLRRGAPADGASTS